jgi:general secretion pathway protein H
MHLVKLLQPIAGQKGFTLIELLVVMAIGAMLVGLAPPAFDRLRSASEYRDTVRGLVTGLKQTRHKAMTQGQIAVFTIDLGARNFGTQEGVMQKLPEGIELKTTTGNKIDSSENSKPAILFMPDGGSSGGTIDVIRTSGQGVRIRIDWLLGHISQEPRTP